MASVAADRIFSGIKNAFEWENISFRTHEEEPVLYVEYAITDTRNITCMVRVSGTGEFILLRAFSLTSPIEDEGAKKIILSLCNEMNDNYMWTRFYLDKDNELTAAIERPVTRKNAGTIALKLLGKLVNLTAQAIERLDKLTEDVFQL